MKLLLLALLNLVSFSAFAQDYSPYLTCAGLSRMHLIVVKKEGFPAPTYMQKTYTGQIEVEFGVDNRWQDPNAFTNQDEGFRLETFPVEDNQEFAPYKKVGARITKDGQAVDEIGICLVDSTVHWVGLETPQKKP
jgi:hypothetical protein